MAQQGTVKRTANDVPVKNKGGRPPGSRNAPKPKNYDFDAPKRDFQKPLDFYQYLAAYPDKTALLLSVYRLRPKIDHSLMGIDQSAILQTANPDDVTEEALGETFGRGKYMLKLNDSNKPKGMQLRCRTWLDITDVEKPPQYDPRTLCLGEAQNQDEIMRLLNAGVLVRDGHGAPRLRGEGDPLPIASPPMAGQAGNPGGDLFSRDVVGQIVLAALNRGSQSPHETVKDTIEIARLLRPEPAAAVPSIDQIADAVATRLSGAVRGGSDPFSQWEKVEAFIERARGVVNPAAAGPAAASSADGWGPYLADIIRETRALVPEILNGLQVLKSMKTAGPQQAPPPESGPVMIEKLPMLPMDQRIETLFRAGFQSMQRGITGTQFAEWVCLEFPGGREAFDQLRPGGAQGLLTMAGMHPQGRLIVNDEKLRGQLDVFLSEFFAFASGEPAAA
jgi:hypothetical protein